MKFFIEGVVNFYTLVGGCLSTLKWVKLISFLHLSVFLQPRFSICRHVHYFTSKKKKIREAFKFSRNFWTNSRTFQAQKPICQNSKDFSRTDSFFKDFSRLLWTMCFSYVPTKVTYVFQKKYSKSIRINTWYNSKNNKKNSKYYVIKNLQQYWEDYTVSTWDDSSLESIQKEVHMWLYLLNLYQYPTLVQKPWSNLKFSKLFQGYLKENLKTNLMSLQFLHSVV